MNQNNCFTYYSQMTTFLILMNLYLQPTDKTCYQAMKLLLFTKHLWNRNPALGGILVPRLLTSGRRTSC